MTPRHSAPSTGAVQVRAPRGPHSPRLRRPGIRLRLGPVAGAALLSLTAAPLWAQTASAPTPPKTESVVVTGTLIRGAAPVGSDLIRIDRNTIEQSGVATTSDLLRQVPQIVNLGADEGHTNAVQNANANITFGTGINLRGLGTESTLTLVNGRRVVPNGTMGQFIDTSMIPTLALRGMEVVPDGASSTYGSDAVGGVVNILLREHYNGAQTELRYGSGRQIDGWQFGQLWGKTWDSGAATVTFEHFERSRLRAQDRAYYTDDLRPFGGPDLRVVGANPGNIQIGSTRYAIPANQNGSGLTPGRFTAGTSNLQSIYAGGADALPQQTRDSLVATFNQQLSERINLFAHGYYARRDFQRHTTAQAPAVNVPRSNPYFVCPGTCGSTVTVNYSFLDDLGPTDVTGYEKVSNATLGLNIELGAGWNSTLYTSFGDNRDQRVQRNFINNAQLQKALADTNPATALNVFGDGSFTHPATLDKIRAVQQIDARYKLSDTAITADGPVASLPGGKLRLAVGLEYQEHRNANQLQSSQTTPDNTTMRLVSAGDVRRTVQSAFVEANLPLVGAANATAWARQLGLSLAARHDRYSDFGATTNPKLGLTWMPTPSLTLRSSYGTSFRAPSLADSDPSQGGTVSLVNFVDASSKTGITRGILRQGGNLALAPEKAKSWTLGVEFKPTARSTVGLTYFDIDYKDRILTPANLGTQALVQEATLAAFIARNPGAATVNALFASPFFTGIAENPANVLVVVDGRKHNTGQARTQGLDLTGRWRSGAWDAGGNVSYFFKFQQSLVRGTPLEDVLNTVNNPLRLTARGDLGYTGAGYTARLALNHANAYENKLVKPAARVSAYTTADLLLSYDTGYRAGGLLGQGLKLALSVQNLLDRKPPYVQNGTLAFDPQVVSAIGRYASLSVSAKW